ncbi:hypothetical protein [Thiomonas sp.]
MTRPEAPPPFDLCADVMTQLAAGAGATWVSRVERDGQTISVSLQLPESPDVKPHAVILLLAAFAQFAKASFVAEELPLELDQLLRTVSQESERLLQTGVLHPPVFTFRAPAGSQ